jgi:hypothetical protein
MDHTAIKTTLRVTEPADFLNTWLEFREKGALCRLLSDTITSRPENSRDEESRFWSDVKLRALDPNDGVEQFVSRLNPVPGATTTIDLVASAEAHPLALLIEIAALISQGRDSNEDTHVSAASATSYAVPTEKRLFALIVRRTLMDAPVIGTAVVPIAIHDESNNCGWIGRLSLEVLQGPRAIANHPDQFAMGFDSSQLEPSMNAAWEAACEMVLGRKQTLFCGRWRFWTRDTEEYHYVKPTGPSLGAAAARGWVTALAQAAKSSGVSIDAPMVIDPRLLVIAQVCCDPQRGFILGPVNDSGVQKKVEELCNIVNKEVRDHVEISIDRIAVVDGPAIAGTAVVKEGNLRTAQLVIAEAKLGEWIDAVDIATYTPPTVEPNSAAAGSP